MSVRHKLLRQPTSSLDDCRKSGAYTPDWKDYIASWRLSKGKSLDDATEHFHDHMKGFMLSRIQEVERLPFHVCGSLFVVDEKGIFHVQNESSRKRSEDHF